MRKSLPYIYFVVNVVCALIVLYAAHRVSALMAMEQRTDPDGVDGVSFFVFAGPAWAVALVTSVPWAAKSLGDAVGRRAYGSLAWLAAVLAVWVAAMHAIPMV